MTNNPSSTTTCSRCGGEVNAHAKFCQHCGSSLQSAQAAPVQAPPATRICPACQQEVPADNAFCIHCGQNMNAPVASAQPAVATIQCSACGRQNDANMRFCGGCGNGLTTGQGQYPQQYPQPAYGQAAYQQPQYPQQQGGYQQPQYPQQYNQGGYQQPMTLRCPVCMAMAPIGTANCPGCRTSLANVVPTPMNMPVQGQQGMLGGLGNMFGGNGGNMAMGALGGAAAVIGGEILLHGVENRIDGGYRHHRDEGLLGDLGDLANDVGLF